MTIMNKKVLKKCDLVWKNLWQGQDDERAYCSGGMYYHPCGRTYQEGGRDGFEKSSGRERCPCKICEAVRNHIGIGPLLYIFKNNIDRKDYR